MKETKEGLLKKVNELFKSSKGYFTKEDIELIKRYRDTFRNTPK